MAQIIGCGHRAAAPYDGMQYRGYNWRKGGGASRRIEISQRERCCQQGYGRCVYSLRDTNRQRKRGRIRIGVQYYGADDADV